jgi:hypothetical protein
MVDQNIDIVELVKERLRIEEIIEADGYPLDNRNRKYRKCTTPHTGGLVVNTNLQLYFWNTRGEHGDVISWVMQHHRLDFKGAVDWLCDRAGIERPNWGKADPAARLAARLREEAMDVAQRVFRSWFRKSAEAQAYAARRGWTLGTTNAEGEYEPGTADLALLGYSGEGTESERAEMARALQAAGIELDSLVVVAILGYQGDVARWAREHDVSSIADDWLVRNRIPGMLGQKRLVYPHIRNGRIIYLSGRSIDAKRHYNLPESLVGKKQPYLNHEYAPAADHCTVVEGQADAVSLGQLGYSGLALAGVSPDADLAQILRRHKTLYVGLDADAAGLKNAWKVAEVLGPLVRVINWQAHRRTLTIEAEGKRRAAETADELVQALVMDRARGERPQVIVDLLAMLPRVRDDHGFERSGWTDETGAQRVVQTATDLLHGIRQVWRDPGEAAQMERAMLRELLDWSPAYIAGDDVNMVKDANDLLRAFVGAGLTKEEQQERLSELYSQAETYVEQICSWAGSQDGAARDDALPQALRVVARLEDFELTTYRKDLAKRLGVQLRELGAMLKALVAKEEREKSDGEPVYTWGGCINGWMIEYLYDVEQDRALLAWRDPQGRIDSGPEVIIEGKRYLPYPQNETLRSGAIVFASALGERKSIAELVAYIELYLNSIYIMPSDQTARLVAYWVLSTWLYDCFETVIYLRAMGGAGSGKSEFVKRVGLICYRTMTANGAGSTSSLFRAVERYKGSVILDEADLQQSDTEADMVKFYNLGAMRGNPIWRTVEVTGPNGQKDWEEKAFQTFCPKLIAMRKDFRDDAVGTRSLTLKLQPRETTELVAAGVPLTINAGIRARAQALRNLLMRWRMENWQPEIEVDASFYDLTISARLNQVAGPLLAIARDDPDQQEDIRKTLREYYQETIINQSMTLSARVLEALWKIYQYPDLHKEMVKVESDGSEIIKIGDVTRITNDIINEMNDDDSSDGEEENSKFKARELKSQKVGRIIRGDLNLKVTTRRRDGFWVYWNQPRMEGLSVKFGINPADFGPQQNGQNGAAKPAPKAQNSLL